MSDALGRDLSCTAKLACVVLDNRGPLSAREFAEEAHLGVAEAREALRELEGRDLAESVCGVCHSREEVYALTDRAEDVCGTNGRSA
ncbi:MAG: hypothetical protein ABEJ70_01835 [Halobacteriaceae archaeon]